MLLTEEVMKRDLRTSFEHVSVAELAEVMRAGGVGAILIVERNSMKKLRGIVTDRDIVTRVIAAGRDPSRTTAAEVMTRSIVICGTETPLDDAMYLMVKHNIRRLPVIDDENSIVGIVSIADVLCRLRPSEHSEPSVEQFIASPTTIDRDDDDTRNREALVFEEQFGDIDGKLAALSMRASVAAGERSKMVPAPETVRELKLQKEALHELFCSLRTSKRGLWEEKKAMLESCLKLLKVRTNRVIKSWSAQTSTLAP